MRVAVLNAPIATDFANRYQMAVKSRRNVTELRTFEFAYGM